MVPIENLVNGSIREVYDLLLEHPLEIVGDVVVPVDLCLAALPSVPLAAVERVYSHIQALGQAERFLRAGGWALLTTYNTAGAGRFVLAQNDRGAAAVLSRRAAEGLGMEVLASSIQDVPDNRTRFYVVGMPGAEGFPSGANEPTADGRRTTIAFGVRNEPGTLLAALGVFARRGINLEARVSAEPGSGLGVRLLGRPRCPGRGRGDRGCARRAARRGLDGPDPGLLSAVARHLRGGDRDGSVADGPVHGLCRVIQPATVASDGRRQIQLGRAASSSWNVCARLVALRWASSAGESTPAASRSSEYSPPTPSMRIRSAWLAHFRSWSAEIPVAAARRSRPLALPPCSRRSSVELTPAPGELVPEHRPDAFDFVDSHDVSPVGAACPLRESLRTRTMRS